MTSRNSFIEQVPISDNDGISFNCIDIYSHNRNLKSVEKGVIEVKKASIAPEPLDCTYYEPDSGSDSESGKNGSGKYRADENYNRKYVIDLFGVDDRGNDYCLHVIDYKPYFYVRVPKKTDKVIFMTRLQKTLLGEHGVMPAKYRKFLKKISYCERMDFYGFTNNVKKGFVKLEFENSTARQECAWALGREIRLEGSSGKTKLDLYEANLDGMLRFLHLRNLKPCGWVKVEKSKLITLAAEDRMTNCAYEYSAKYTDIFPDESKQHLGKAMTCSFDIECKSSDGYSFPEAKNDGDEVIQIGTTFRWQGEKQSFLKHIITLKKCAPIDGVEVESYDNEVDELLAWTNLIRRMRPDIKTGYNIFGFDEDYLYQRAKLLGCLSKFLCISKYIKKVCRFDNTFLQSSAMGDNTLRYIRMPGTCKLDMLKVIQNQVDEKLGSYKLDFVANHYLKVGKEDLKPKEIWENYNKGTPECIKKIAIYCIKDTELVQELKDIRMIDFKDTGMANACSVPRYYLYVRGKGICVFSVVSKFCNDRGYIIPVIKYKESEGLTDEEKDGLRVRGAYVVEPVPGVHYFVATLDYNSLYPSIMRAHNFSHDTAVLEEEYDNIPGVQYRKVSYYLRNGTKKTVKFVKKESYEGIIPQILEFLVTMRKKVQKEMTDEEKSDNPDPIKIAVMNGDQMALKIVANSVYGITIAKTSQLYMESLGGCTTAKGQDAIIFAQDTVLNRHPTAEIVYGDTDSIFPCYHINYIKKEDFETNEQWQQAMLTETFKIATEDAEAITASLSRAPMKIELEKVWTVLATLSKKRYSGMLCTEPDIHKAKRKDSGSALKRRDSAKIVKHFCDGVMTGILQMKDAQQNRDFVEQAVQQTLRGEFDLSYFTKSATLRKEYKKGLPVHAEVAEQVRQRDPGNAYMPNERVPFVFRKIPVELNRLGRPKKVKKSAQAYSPEFLVQDGEVVDYKLYLTDQVKNPLVEILSLQNSDAKEFFDELIEKYGDIEAENPNYEGVNEEDDEIEEEAIDRDADEELLMI